MLKSVYIMRSKGIYKIGVSEDPHKRLRALRTGNPDIELIYTSERIGTAYKIEGQLHKDFNQYSVGGEWFAICEETKLIDAVKALVSTMSNEIKSTSATNKSDQISEIIDWLFEPWNKQLKALCAEVDSIEEENRKLKEELIKSGWSVEEVELIISNALKSVSV